jgi:predicted DNA-binding transcriptional regulator YafY
MPASPTARPVATARLRSAIIPIPRIVRVHSSPPRVYFHFMRTSPPGFVIAILHACAVHIPVEASLSYSFSAYGKNISKILKAVDLLARPQGATNKELASHLGLSSRSVFRLLSTLGDLGFPLTDERDSFGGETRHFLLESFVKKLPNISMPQVLLTPRESLVLYFLLARDSIFADSEVEHDLASLKSKLAALLPGADAPPSGSRTAKPLSSLFTRSPNGYKSYAGHDAILDILLDGLEQLRALHVTYSSPSSTATKSYQVHPLKLFEHRGGLYLFVRLPKHDIIRILAVDRIKAAKLLDTVFAYPQDFDAESLLASAFDLTLDDPVTASIRFSPQEAPFVRERHWSDDQSIENHSDGSITLTLSTSGIRDLLRWLLSFGSGAEILSPSALRDTLRDEALKLANLYSGSISSS